MLGQHQAAVPQKLAAVDHRVHQQVLGRQELVNLLPGEHLAHREHVPVIDGVAGVVLHVLVHIIAHHHVHRVFGEGAQLVHHLVQAGHIQPVVRVHHLVVQAGGVGQALVYALAVAAVGLVDDPHHIGVLFGIPVGNGGGVIGGAVVHQDDLGLIAGLQEGFDAAVHIGGRVVAGHRERDQFQVYSSNFLCSGSDDAGKGGLSGAGRKARRPEADKMQPL